MKKNLLLVLLACCILSQHNSSGQITLTTFSTGFTKAIDIANCGDSRVFVAEQPGRIIICDSAGNKNPIPFLDFTSHVNSTGLEKGLLSFTFAKDYLSSGYFYIYYVPQGGSDSRISRFHVSADPNIADSLSEQVILTVPQPVGSHYGGDMSFGHDGYLYIGLGDGGPENDPDNHAQDTSLLLGKFLRIDVSNTSLAGYTVPESNPFVNRLVHDEIWSIGFRNPWKFSFDRYTNDMWIGDVGQSSEEEVDFQPANSTGGENYGWRCYEGTNTFNTVNCNPSSYYVPPVYEYTHAAGGCSVIGGSVYRGSSFNSMFGKYFFADWCNNNVHYLVRSENGSVTETNLGALGGATGFISFGEDEWGDLYTGTFAGTVYKFTDATTHHVAFISSKDTLHVCGDSTYTLRTPAGPGFHYIWYRDGVFQTGDTSDLLITQPGHYYVTVFNASFVPQNSDSVYVRFDPLPVVAMTGVDTLYCADNPDIQVNVSPAGGTFSIDNLVDTTYIIQPYNMSFELHQITYTYADSTTCSNTVKQNLRIEECLGVREIKSEGITLYPVPADDKLILKTGNISSADFDILDITGRKILLFNNIQPKNNLFELNISEITTGVYFLNIRSSYSNKMLKWIKR